MNLIVLSRAEGIIARLQPFKSCERQPAVRLLQFYGMLRPPRSDFLLPTRLLRWGRVGEKNRKREKAEAAAKVMPLPRRI